MYYQKAVLFSFVDEFNNYVSAYYMLQGKVLYKEIFFNHQMLMPYISYVLQKTLSPNSIYQYVLYHRLFVIVFSLILGVILTYRFGYLGFLFVVLYELTKFYCFGNHFLAESLIVYPLVYLFGISWAKLYKYHISNVDIFLSSLFTIFIIFLREPFIPVTILLFCVIFWKRKMDKLHYSILAIIGITSLILMTTVSIKDYLYQVMMVNFDTVTSYEIQKNNLSGFGIIKMIFYPLDILLEGKLTYFRMILVVMDIFFLIFISLYIYLYKKIKNALFIFIVLSLCAIRYVIPGTQYYEAYRLLPWYGIFLMTTLLLMQQIAHRISEKPLRYCMIGLFAIGIIILVSLPQSFIWEPNNREQDFHRNYGQYTGAGDLMRLLAEKDDTVFVEGWDSMIYLDAKITPAYPYIYYYPIITNIARYSALKDAMFRHKAPDFYYTCYNQKGPVTEVIKKQYVQISYKSANICIHVKKEKFKKISISKINILKQQGYSINE